MLPLTFHDWTDYDKIELGDRIELVGVDGGEMQPGRQVTMKVTPKDGSVWRAMLNHSFHSKQVEWLRAGSALNHVKNTTLKALNV